MCALNSQSQYATLKRYQLQKDDEEGDDISDSDKKAKRRYSRLRSEMRKLNLHPELLAYIGGIKEPDSVYKSTDNFIKRNVVGSSEYYREVLLLDSISKVTNLKRNSLLKPVNQVLTKSRTKSKVATGK